MIRGRDVTAAWLVDDGAEYIGTFWGGWRAFDYASLGRLAGWGGMR